MDDVAISEAQTIFTILVRGLIDSPDAVHIDTKTDGNQTGFTLRLAKSDIGKVIGKQGRSARALRILLHAVAVKHGRHFTLDIPDA